MRADNPCVRSCPQRRQGCHSYCTAYKAYREIIDKENARRQKESRLNEFTELRKLRVKKKLRREKKCALK